MMGLWSVKPFVCLLALAILSTQAQDVHAMGPSAASQARVASALNAPGSDITLVQNKKARNIAIGVAAGAAAAIIISEAARAEEARRQREYQRQQAAARSSSGKKTTKNKKKSTKTAQSKSSGSGQSRQAYCSQRWNYCMANQQAASCDRFWSMCVGD